MPSTVPMVGVGGFRNLAGSQQGLKALGQSALDYRDEQDKRSATRANLAGTFDISNTLNSGIQGKEVQNYVNSAYTDLTDRYKKETMENSDLIAQLKSKVIPDPMTGIALENPKLDYALQRKNELKTNYNKKLDGLNTDLQGMFKTDRNVLNTIVNPDRVQQDVYSDLIKKGIDPDRALKVAQSQGNTGKETDYDLIKLLRGQQKDILDLAPVITTENKEENKQFKPGSGTGSSKAFTGSAAGGLHVKKELDKIQTKNPGMLDEYFVENNINKLEAKIYKVIEDAKEKGHNVDYATATNALVDAVMEGSKTDNLYNDVGLATKYVIEGRSSKGNWKTPAVGTFSASTLQKRYDSIGGTAKTFYQDYNTWAKINGKPQAAIASGNRTQAEQNKLYAQGRTAPGNIVTWTKNSKHIGGNAMDLVAGSGYTNKDANTTVAKSIRQFAKENPQYGASFLSMGKDPNHIQFDGGVVTQQTNTLAGALSPGQSRKVQTKLKTLSPGQRASYDNLQTQIDSQLYSGRKSKSLVDVLGASFINKANTPFTAGMSKPEKVKVIEKAIDNNPKVAAKDKEAAKKVVTTDKSISVVESLTAGTTKPKGFDKAEAKAIAPKAIDNGTTTYKDGATWGEGADFPIKPIPQTGSKTEKQMFTELTKTYDVGISKLGKLSDKEMLALYNKTSGNNVTLKKPIGGKELKSKMLPLGFGTDARVAPKKPIKPGYIQIADALKDTSAITAAGNHISTMFKARGSVEEHKKAGIAAVGVLNNMAASSIEIAGSPYTVAKMLTDWLTTGTQQGSAFTKNAKAAEAIAKKLLNEAGVKNPTTQEVILIGSELLIPGGSIKNAIKQGPIAASKAVKKLVKPGVTALLKSPKNATKLQRLKATQKLKNAVKKPNIIDILEKSRIDKVKTKTKSIRKK